MINRVAEAIKGTGGILSVDRVHNGMSLAVFQYVARHCMQLRALYSTP